MITTLIAATLLRSGSSVSGSVLDGSQGLGEAVVWLKGSTKVQPINAEIVQRGKMFEPHILVVPAGSTVDFPNRDDIFHNVFAEYQAKKFDLGMYPKGQTRKVKFDKPGVVSVLCNIHRDMSAFVIVVDSNHFAKANRQGKFTIPNVPPGSYIAEVWHESGKTGLKTIKVDGASTQVTLTVARR